MRFDVLVRCLYGVTLRFGNAASFGHGDGALTDVRRVAVENHALIRTATIRSNSEVKEMTMTITEFFLGELDREVERSRNGLNEVPDGQYEWRPHEKSMIFGYLADMVATIPTWISMEIRQHELDVAPADGSQTKQKQKKTRAELLKALDEATATARSALENTNDDHLMTSWRLLARGNVVWEGPRHTVIQDTFNHWAHHRGQMTVYLRLMGAKVPALYGPSADENRF